MVSLSSLRPFGPRRATATLRAGRYSICVNLGAQDGFYWIKRDDGESQPVRGPEGVALLETHCHSAFYDVESSEGAKACVGG